MPDGSVRKDPDRKFRYVVEIDGIVQSSFSEVIMPDSTSDPIEYREGAEPTYTRKIPGLTKFGNLTLKWSITDSTELYNWRKLVEQGKMKDARRNLAVILIDEEGNPAARWEFHDAWPCRYSAPILNAEENCVAIETLEIAFEKMERVQ